MRSEKCLDFIHFFRSSAAVPMSGRLLKHDYYFITSTKSLYIELNEEKAGDKKIWYAMKRDTVDTFSLVMQWRNMQTVEKSQMISKCQFAWYNIHRYTMAFAQITQKDISNCHYNILVLFSSSTLFTLKVTSGNWSYRCSLTCTSIIYDMLSNRIEIEDF